MAELKIGDLAPDFDLPKGGGGRVSLSKLRGKAVVLFFYPQDDTAGCTAEAISFFELKSKFSRAGVRLVGVSPDPVAKHEKFARKHELTVDLVSDESRSAIEAYGVWAEKQLYGRKYMGVERSTFLIDPEGRIAAIWRKLRVAGHAEAVLDAAKALKKADVTA